VGAGVLSPDVLPMIAIIIKFRMKFRATLKYLLITLLLVSCCSFGGNRMTVKAGVPGMVFIPPGEFMMGCNRELDPDCRDQERPAHMVYLDGFYIDKREVTVAEYRKCVKARGCSDERVGWYDFTDFGFERAVESPMCNYFREGRDEHPMNCVTWFEAREFCKWAGKRLPTEAEWEKAARGNDARIYPWGNEPPDCSKVVHIKPHNGPGCGTYATFRVGAKKGGRSPYGVENVAGNVWEWTADLYDPAYFEYSRRMNPTGAVRGDRRTFKGGAWAAVDRFMRVSHRLGFPPEYRSFNAGFRCAR